VNARISHRRLRAGLVLATLAVAVLAFAPGAFSAVKVPKVFPAGGELVSPSVKVHAEPNAKSKVLRVLKQFRPDFHFQVLLILGAEQDAKKKWWYELSIPGRPNGQRGWIRATEADWWFVPNRIVIHRVSRKLEVIRMKDGKVLVSGTVAVGKPGAETPLGRDFYVQSRFVPANTFLGVFALETSAYSKLTDWPGGGVAGIHGTSAPQLLGQAVSHGCIRVHNEIAAQLRKLAPLGTPIDIVEN
jgi:lipoprotein-anchoring transpeptidase ErfK/SrfK